MDLAVGARSKTPAGWRDPYINDTCLQALGELHARAQRLGFAERNHFLFPWHGQYRKLDPTRPMTSWRSAWRSLRKAAGLPHVRFHDGRHTALTRLAEKGVADWVIRAQFGHVSPAMMAVYGHVRREALDEQPALEPEAAADTVATGLTATRQAFATGYVTCDVTIGPTPKQRDRFRRWHSQERYIVQEIAGAVEEVARPSLRLDNEELEVCDPVLHGTGVADDNARANGCEHGPDFVTHAGSPW